jgi:hypothetical protein
MKSRTRVAITDISDDFFSSQTRAKTHPVSYSARPTVRVQVSSHSCLPSTKQLFISLTHYQHNDEPQAATPHLKAQHTTPRIPPRWLSGPASSDADESDHLLQRSRARSPTPTTRSTMSSLLANPVFALLAVVVLIIVLAGVFTGSTSGSGYVRPNRSDVDVDIDAAANAATNADVVFAANSDVIAADKRAQQAWQAKVASNTLKQPVQTANDDAEVDGDDDDETNSDDDDDKDDNDDNDDNDSDDDESNGDADDSSNNDAKGDGTDDDNDGETDKEKDADDDTADASVNTTDGKSIDATPIDADASKSTGESKPDNDNNGGTETNNSQSNASTATSVDAAASVEAAASMEAAQPAPASVSKELSMMSVGVSVNDGGGSTNNAGDTPVTDTTADNNNADNVADVTTGDIADDDTGNASVVDSKAGNGDAANTSIADTKAGDGDKVDDDAAKSSPAATNTTADSVGVDDDGDNNASVANVTAGDIDSTGGDSDGIGVEVEDVDAGSPPAATVGIANIKVDDADASTTAAVVVTTVNIDDTNAAGASNAATAGFKNVKADDNNAADASTAAAAGIANVKIDDADLSNVTSSTESKNDDTANVVKTPTKPPTTSGTTVSDVNDATTTDPNVKDKGATDSPSVKDTGTATKVLRLALFTTIAATKRSLPMIAHFFDYCKTSFSSACLHLHLQYVTYSLLACRRRLCYPPRYLCLTLFFCLIVTPEQTRACFALHRRPCFSRCTPKTPTTDGARETRLRNTFRTHVSERTHK